MPGVGSSTKMGEAGKGLKLVILNYEIGAPLDHPVDKNFQPVIRVVHLIFMHIGPHAKAHETILFPGPLRPGQGSELRDHE